MTSFNDAAVQAHATQALLEGTQIQRWFAVQCAVTHPRLCPMPLGIDGRDVQAFQPVQTEKTTWLYLNFQPRNDERRDLLTHFAPHSWVKTDAWQVKATSAALGYGPSMGLIHYAQRLASSRFVLSPPGRGWDCYRTYEAMAMGAIPIVKRNPPMSAVVSGLPALVVDDWSEVTPERLRAEWEQRKPANLERMTLNYWRDAVSCAAP